MTIRLNSQEVLELESTGVTKHERTNQDPLYRSMAAKLKSETFGDDLTAEEKELLQEIIRGRRSMRFGSIVVTVHEGHIVEVDTTVRVRKRLPKLNQ